RAPHSRHTEVDQAMTLSHPDLTILSTSEEAGLYLATSKDGRMVFVTGHSEYDQNTLDEEYIRDIKAGMCPKPPLHYYQNDHREEGVTVTWRGHANLLFSNWLNYHVYQGTPYDLTQLNVSKNYDGPLK
ncbi:MAG: homoserine O-succinyltransferase, partial [Spirochaetia bacterium]|nr:homoserine O-succinyltransferase [Spirochaetia bacterium]